jgi:hypothetical protein
MMMVIIFLNCPVSPRCDEPTSSGLLEMLMWPSFLGEITDLTWKITVRINSGYKEVYKFTRISQHFGSMTQCGSLRVHHHALTSLLFGVFEIKVIF